MDYDKKQIEKDNQIFFTKGIEMHDNQLNLKKNLKRHHTLTLFLTKIMRLRLLLRKNRKSNLIKSHGMKKVRNAKLVKKRKFKRKNGIKVIKELISNIENNRFEKSIKSNAHYKTDKKIKVLEKDCPQNPHPLKKQEKNENFQIISKDQIKETNKMKKSLNDDIIFINSLEEKKSFIQKQEKNEVIDNIIKEYSQHIFVKNISYKINANELLDIFKQFGNILNINLPLRNNKSRGFAFIEFEKE